MSDSEKKGVPDEVVMNHSSFEEDSSTPSPPSLPTKDNMSTSSSDKEARNKDVVASGQHPGESAVEQVNLGTARIAVIMLSICIALFLAALDMTIITTALPTIASTLSATASQYTWVGSAYLLASAASVPLWGKLSDIWGRKPVILAANVVFLVGSLLCAISINIQMLIGGRVVQGIGGGGLIILVNIVISDLFSMRDRAKYFGIVGMVWAFASALGPVLGGVFTEKVSWRWCVSSNDHDRSLSSSCD
jgi:fucose permease